MFYKKLIPGVSFICAIVFCVSPVTAFASNSTEDDAVFSQEEFESLEHVYAVYPQTRVTGYLTF